MNLRNLKPLAIVMFCLLFAFNAMAQNGTSGKVVNKDGVGIPGVTVSANGKALTTTDANGKFSTTVTSGKLSFTSIGYEGATANAGSDNTEVLLAVQVGSQAEVVVIGYGSVRRKDVTGSVGKVTSANFNQGAITNGLEALQGKVAGVAITPVGGDPNGQSTIRIRGIGSINGNADPLVVVDGVQLSEAKYLNDIPPSEIESFDILKDASATAIYGSRGANGVVLVTTKKGRNGQAKVEYSSFITSEKVANTVDLMSASDVKSYFAANNPLLDGGSNTNWVKAISRKGFTHSHTVSVSGGTDKFNYRGALGYYKREGVLLNSGKENINARLAVEQKALNNKLNIQLNVIYNTANKDYIDYGSSVVNSTISGVGQESLNPFLFAYSMNPTNPIYNNSATNPYGGFYQPNQYASQNPVAFLKQISNKGKENNLNTSAKLEYSLTKDLKAFVFGSYNTINTINDFFSPTTAYNTPLGYAKKGNFNELNLLGNYGLNYRKVFASKHNFDATVVYEYYKNRKDNFEVAVQDLKYNNVQSNNLALAGTVLQGYPKSNKEEYTIISFLGRVNYNYNNKYFVTASVRRDGSSKLGINNQWGTFPSVSGAWAVSKENFMHGTAKWLNDLKLRVGYGITGNQNGVGATSSLAIIGPGNPTLVNGTVTVPQVFKQNPNFNLQWEEKKQFNAGIDFAVLNNKLTGSIDVYSGKTNNLLFDIEKVGIGNYLESNVGEIINGGGLDNKGLEISLSSPVVNKNDFKLNVSGNISFNTNKVTGFDGNGTDKVGNLVSFARANNQIPWGTIYGRGLSFSNVTFLEVGQPLGTILVPHYTGKNALGEPQIASDQRKDFVRFNPLPKFVYGFSLNPTYKNFYGAINFRGVSGNKIYNGTLTNLDNKGRLADGDNASKDAVAHGFTKPQISDYFVESGSFLRLDNMSIGYSVPLPSTSAIKNLKVFIAANNVFIITKYKGTDPEVGIADNKNIGIENINVYPKNKSVTLGVNVGF